MRASGRRPEGHPDERSQGRTSRVPGSRTSVSYVRTRAGFPGSPTHRSLGRQEPAGRAGRGWPDGLGLRHGAETRCGHPRRDSGSGASSCTPFPELRAPSTLRLQNPWGPQVRSMQPRTSSTHAGDSVTLGSPLPGWPGPLGAGYWVLNLVPPRHRGPPPKAVQTHLGCTGERPGRDLARPGRAASSLSATLSL